MYTGTHKRKALPKQGSDLRVVDSCCKNCIYDQKKLWTSLRVHRLEDTVEPQTLWIAMFY